MNQSVIDSLRDEVPAAFIDQLSNFSSIPYWRGEKLDSVRIVRFRCQIADCCEPEVFIHEYEVNEPTGIKSKRRNPRFLEHSTEETSGVDVGEVQLQNSTQLDRNVYVCTNIVGESGWVSTMYQRGLSKSDDSDVDMDCAHTAKRARLSEPTSQCSATNDAHDTACIVRVYANLDPTEYRLNDLVEFVGFLHSNEVPSLDSQSKSSDTNVQNNENSADGLLQDTHRALEEISAATQFESHMPRLYAISGTLLRPTAAISELTSVCDYQSLRAALLDRLESSILPDRLACEYLLASLLSGVHHRDATFAFGKCSLNLFGTPLRDGFASDLQRCLAEFLPLSLHMPLSLAVLNGQTVNSSTGSTPSAPESKPNAKPKRFHSVKNYTTNRIEPGSFQLANGCVVVLDETALQTGQLDTVGVRNVATLRRLLSSQQLLADFGFFEHQYPIDLRLLVLSEARSFVAGECDFCVPVVTRTDASPKPSANGLSEELMNGIRSYLARCAELNRADFKISEATQSVIQSDFVESRRRAKSNEANGNKEKENEALFASLTGEADLHRALTLARLLAVSFGEQELSVDRWRCALQLEGERARRLAAAK